MIITRSPLRITLGGGGTDLPSYYRAHEGFLLSAAIDKYVYITLHSTFKPNLIIKYSKLEEVTSLSNIQHPLLRETLAYLNIAPHYLEITSMADIPAGTGLGSSGSFTTALLKALHAKNKHLIPPHTLAEQACHIEIDRLKEPVGKQDQYIAALGGITAFKFLKNDAVETIPLSLNQETLYNLEDHLLLFFTGYTRSASQLLAEQDQKSKLNDKTMTDHLHFIKQLGKESQAALESGNLVQFAELMNVHWEHKKQRAQGMTNTAIDHYYQLGRAQGALGGKVIGAGGGGFLMFYAEDKIRLRRAMTEAGLPEVRFRFDFEGTQTVASS